MRIDRYRDVIPDWDAFLDTIHRPEPTTLRARRGRISRDDLANRLEDQGFRTEPVAGMSSFLRVLDGPRPVALTREHWRGLFYVQQAVTGVAAQALAPEPGERVLDMCASPGGKTTHMAELMDTRGCLVAADKGEGRLKGLMGNLTRLLIPNVVAMVADGRRFPAGALFDRILVDAPCSAEGNLRKKGGEMREPKASFVRHVTGLQERILRRGISLLRPGGTLLYATCTFAPEENEAVVSRVLADSPVRMLPLDLSVPSAPGLTRFEGLAFDPSLELAHRLYPHHLNSGGLFMALLEKDGPALRNDVGWSPVPLVFPGESCTEGDARAWLKIGENRMAGEFGIGAEEMANFEWMLRGDSGWIHKCGEWPVDAWEPGEWRISSVGLRGLSPGARGSGRPTNYVLRMFENATTTRRVSLSGSEAMTVLRRESFDGPHMDPGYVTLDLEGSVVGRATTGRSGIRHEIPKARAASLLKLLGREQA